MARTPKIMSIYDKLDKNEQDIVSTENKLKQLKSEREELLKEKDDFEMRTLWAEIKKQNLSMEDIQSLISKNTKTK